MKSEEEGKQVWEANRANVEQVIFYEVYHLTIMLSRDIFISDKPRARRSSERKLISKAPILQPP